MSKNGRILLLAPLFENNSIWHSIPTDQSAQCPTDLIPTQMGGNSAKTFYRKSRIAPIHAALFWKEPVFVQCVKSIASENFVSNNSK